MIRNIIAKGSVVAGGLVGVVQGIDDALADDSGRTIKEHFLGSRDITRTYVGERATTAVQWTKDTVEDMLSDTVPKPVKGKGYDLTLLD